MNGPFIGSKDLGEIKAQPVKMRRSSRGAFGRQTIPSLVQHPLPILFVVHNGHQYAVIRVNNHNLAPRMPESVIPHDKSLSGLPDIALLHRSSPYRS